MAVSPVRKSEGNVSISLRSGERFPYAPVLTANLARVTTAGRVCLDGTKKGISLQRLPRQVAAVTAALALAAGAPSCGPRPAASSPAAAAGVGPLAPAGGT